jgi:hypothetical protein
MRGAALAPVCALVVVLTTRANAEPTVLDLCSGSFEEAQLKEKRGKLVAARKLYEACAVETCPKLMRDDCTKRRDDVDRAIPTASFVLRDAAGKEIEATWTVDDQEVRNDGRASPIDPGPHVVAYAIGGRKAGSEKVTIHEGEKSRVIVFTTTSAALAPPKTTAQPSPAADVPTAAAPAGQSRSVGPYVVGGIGVLFLGASIGLYVISRNEAAKGSELRDRAAVEPANRAALDDTANTRFDAADNNLALAFVAAGVAVAAIGTAVVWYVLDTPKKRAVVAAPLVGPTVGGGAFAVSF